MINTLNSSYTRIGGLSSGLDTETLVQRLTMGVQNRIQIAEQQKQQLEWKQNDYREILTKLTDFNNKYFGSSLSSLTFGDSIKQLNATSSHPQYVTAVGSSNSLPQSVFFGDITSLATSAKVQGANMVSGQLEAELDPLKYAYLGGKEAKVTVDGISKTVTFADIEYSSSQDVATELEGLLNQAFGTGKIQVALDENTLSLSAQNSRITINATGDVNKEAIDYLGFTNGSSNRINLNTKIENLNLATPLNSQDLEFTINGVDFSINGGSTLSSVINTINNSAAGVRLSYSTITDTFVLTAKETGVASNIVFSDTTGNFCGSLLGEGILTQGTDAIVKVGFNGETAEENLVTLVRSSNTFEIDGTTYTLHDKAPENQTENTTVRTLVNVDDMVEKIAEFVNEYNNLIGHINTKISEPYYKDFLPLTYEQKTSLSEGDQKLWTEKAQSGLLKNDMVLKQIVGDLRSVMFDSVKNLDGSGDNLGLILADIGINTKSYAENGKLHIDENQLRKALSEKPQEVISLLTQNASISYSQYTTADQKKTRYEEAGLMWRLSDVIKNNTSKVGKKGPLVAMVGSPDNNFLGITTYSKKMSDYDKEIIRYTQKLDTEQSRYWAKFTAMEKNLSSLYSQSNWLSQQLSSK